MNQIELLAELDTYLATRNIPQLKWTIGDIKKYEFKGALTRTSSNQADIYDIGYFVYKEGDAAEAAFYSGDPIGSFWRIKAEEYLAAQGYVGRVHKANKPKAICRILDTAAAGEKWILITETAPDTWSEEDITGDISDF